MWRPESRDQPFDERRKVRLSCVRGSAKILPTRLRSESKPDIPASGLDSDLSRVGVTPDLALFGVMPVAYKKLKLNPPGGARVTRKDSGLGDIRAFARYTAYKKNMPGKTFRIAPFAGVELPTGSNTGTDALGRLPPSVQLGSGSWDPLDPCCDGFSYEWSPVQ